jgi:3-oxoacyl-[acyl-carrier-protein] synthase III
MSATRSTTMTNALITGWGMYAPSHVMTNADLTKLVDTSDEWIVSRTGIRERRIAADDETTTTLSVNASRDALAVAGLDAADLDLIILGTCSPDYPMPATACLVGRDLGATRAAAFDLQAACSGFVYALATANGFIRSGMYRNVLVIGVEVLSRFLNWSDRNTCVLFGDGAGALVLKAEDSERGILSTRLHADGRHNELLFVDGGPSTTQTVGKLRMKGREVFRHAVVNLADVLNEVLGDAGISAADVDWVVPHQANARILDATARKLGLPIEKVVVTVDNHANTSAASVPLAFDAAIRDGRIKRGDTIVLEAMGGGFTWGAAVLRY